MPDPDLTWIGYGLSMNFEELEHMVLADMCMPKPRPILRNPPFLIDPVGMTVTGRYPSQPEYQDMADFKAELKRRLLPKEEPLMLRKDFDTFATSTTQATFQKFISSMMFHKVEIPGYIPDDRRGPLLLDCVADFHPLSNGPVAVHPLGLVGIKVDGKGVTTALAFWYEYQAYTVPVKDIRAYGYSQAGEGIRNSIPNSKFEPILLPIPGYPPRTELEAELRGALQANQKLHASLVEARSTLTKFAQSLRANGWVVSNYPLYHKLRSDLHPGESFPMPAAAPAAKSQAPVPPMPKSPPVYLVLEWKPGGQCTYPGNGSTRRTSSLQKAEEKLRGMVCETGRPWVIVQVVAEGTAKTTYSAEVKHVL